MRLELKFRIPDENHITIVVGFMEYVLTQEQYIEIIKPAMRVEGSGFDYIKARNKLLTEYFINGPKEQFSW